MAEKTVFVRVGAKVEGAVAGINKVKASVDDLTKASAPKKADAFSAIADKAAIAGVAVAAGVGMAVKRFADFDKAMSAVQANSGETGATLDALRQSAIELGADTIFSATEAAEGINELAKAGVGAKDVLGGGLKGALDLAAAGQIGVAEAAETAATAMTQFNLQGTDIPHVADLLTNAANKAQGGVSDLAQALKQGGLVAASTGLTIDETTGSLAAFASAGLIGSDAGTSLKTMLQRLSAPSKEAAQLMSELGISAYDANGQFVGMQAVAGQLTEAFKDKTDAERNSAMATIFGSDAVRAANILYNEGAAGIAKWNKEVTEQGAAARQAAILTDNLSGDIERLGGAFDSAFIQAGGAANSSLRTLVQGLTGVVDHVGKIPGPILLAGGALTSLALLAPKGILAFRKYTTQLDQLGISFDKISAKAPRAAKAMSAVGKAAGLFGVAATAVYAFADASDSLNVEKLSADLLHTSDGLGLINKELAASTDNGWGRVSSDIDSFGKALGAAFDPGIINSVDNAIGSFKTIFGAENVSNIANADKALAGIDQALSQLVASGKGDRAAALWAQMTKVAQEQGRSVEDLERKFPGYAAAVAKAGSSASTAASDTSDMVTETERLEQASEDAREALDALKDGLDILGGGQLAQRAATRAWQEAMEDATATNTAAWKEGKTATEIARGQQAALDEIATSTDAVMQAQMDNNASTADLTKTYEAGRKKILEVLAARGIHGKAAEREADKIMGTKDEMQKLIDTYGKTPTTVTTDVKANVGGALANIQSLQRALALIPASKQVDFTAKVDRATRGVTYGAQMATGGPISGPGTKTSDDVPIWASRGEFMQKAAAVDKYGTAFMHAVNNLSFPAHLAKGYAGGGPISYAPRQSFASSASIDYGRLAAAVKSSGGLNVQVTAGNPEQAARRVIDAWQWEVANG